METISSMKKYSSKKGKYLKSTFKFVKLWIIRNLKELRIFNLKRKGEKFSNIGEYGRRDLNLYYMWLQTGQKEAFSKNQLFIEWIKLPVKDESLGHGYRCQQVTFKKVS